MVRICGPSLIFREQCLEKCNIKIPHLASLTPWGAKLCAFGLHEVPQKLSTPFLDTKYLADIIKILLSYFANILCKQG